MNQPHSASTLLRSGHAHVEENRFRLRVVLQYSLTALPPNPTFLVSTKRYTPVHKIIHINPCSTGFQRARHPQCPLIVFRVHRRCQAVSRVVRLLENFRLRLELGDTDDRAKDLFAHDLGHGQLVIVCHMDRKSTRLHVGLDVREDSRLDVVTALGPFDGLAAQVNRGALVNTGFDVAEDFLVLHFGILRALVHALLVVGPNLDSFHPGSVLLDELVVDVLMNVDPRSG